MSLGARASASRWLRSICFAAIMLMLSIGAAAAPATAATFPATCANLQSTINEVALQPSHGAGDTVVLSGLCDASSLKASTGVTLPAGSNFSIEGAPGTTSGFDGAGVTASMLGSGSEEVGTMTISHLTFEHASIEGDGAALAVRAATGLTLSGDSFIENTAKGVTAGALFAYVGGSKGTACPAAGAVALTLAGSTFRGNRLIVGSGIGAGGAAWLRDTCQAAGNVIEANAFEGNRLEANGSSQVVGAGLDFVGPDSGHPDPVTQSGNVFDSNSLVALSGAGNYGGGGEWLEGASLTSVADRFSRNFVAGTTGANWSWAAGLGIVNMTCNVLTPTESTLENAVVEGNSLGPGTPEDIGGAGIYLGCGPSPTNLNHLTLLDSTVTGNSTTGGIAGIEGDTADQLALANSIVAGDSGGPETGGFDGPGASVGASYSDVCAGSSPLPGAGNICANPLLADSGNPASFDVHETAASPTIDAGSNALVPAGLGRDVFGAPRIAATIIEAGCGQGYHRPAVVDMGANEFVGSIIRPGGARICPPVLFRSQFSFPSISVRANGLLILTFKRLAAGRVAALATFKLTRTVVQRVKGVRHHVRKLETITYAITVHSSAHAGNLALSLKPTRRALALLKAHRRLHVALRVTFRATGEAASLPQTRTVLVAYKPPPPKRRHR